MNFPLLILTLHLFIFSRPHDAMGPAEAGEGMHTAGQRGTLKRSGPIRVEKKWELPAVLAEISGLSHLEGDRFACVQDEVGKIFVYNLALSRIEKEIRFAGAGDYEGIAMVGRDAWILRSDGKLFEVTNMMGDAPVVHSHDTPLNPGINLEGLCHDSQNNRLLVAVKDGGRGSREHKEIYAFDLARKHMEGKPVFRIDMSNPVFEDGNSRKKKKQSDIFMSSGIAINPLTRDMYVVDGRRSRLLIMDKDGKASRLFDLDRKLFPQPEGIAFKPTGDLFISNEGNPGNILNVVIGKD